MASVIAFIGISTTQLIIAGVVVLLLFGHRLPGTMRSLGKGITEFKKGLNESDEEEEPKLEDKSVGSKA